MAYRIESLRDTVAARRVLREKWLEHSQVTPTAQGFHILNADGTREGWIWDGSSWHHEVYPWRPAVEGTGRPEYKLK